MIFALGFSAVSAEGINEGNAGSYLTNCSANGTTSIGTIRAASGNCLKVSRMVKKMSKQHFS